VASRDNLDSQISKVINNRSLVKIKTNRDKTKTSQVSLDSQEVNQVNLDNLAKEHSLANLDSQINRVSLDTGTNLAKQTSPDSQVNQISPDKLVNLGNQDKETNLAKQIRLVNQGSQVNQISPGNPAKETNLDSLDNRVNRDSQANQINLVKETNLDSQINLVSLGNQIILVAQQLVCKRRPSSSRLYVDFQMQTPAMKNTLTKYTCLKSADMVLIFLVHLLWILLVRRPFQIKWQRSHSSSSTPVDGSLRYTRHFRIR
jgi:hypothetical protein